MNSTHSRTLDIGVFGVRGIPSTYGGYETFLTALLPELVRRGHAVTMYARGRSFTTSAYQGVRIVPVNALYSSQMETISASLTSGTRAALARHDVALACNVANAVGVGLPRLGGTPVALNTDGLEWTRSKWSPLAQKVFRSLARVSTVTASHLITDCQEMARVYRTEFGASSSVIPYCWTELRPSNDLGHDLPADYALCAGRFVPENHLAEIAAAYVRTRIPAPLVVLGDAPYEDRVASQLREIESAHPGRVRLLGHVSDRPNYAAIVQKASIYVHGHSVGGINPALLEAMGLGANVVALDTPFNREALGPEGSFFPTFGDEFEHQLLQAWNRKDTSSFRQAVRNRAVNEFPLSAVADAYENVLSAVALHRTPEPTRWAQSVQSNTRMLAGIESGAESEAEQYASRREFDEIDALRRAQ